MSVRRSKVCCTVSLSSLLKQLKRLRRTLTQESRWVETPSLTLDSMSHISLAISKALTLPYCPLLRWPQMIFFAWESSCLNLFTSAALTDGVTKGTLEIVINCLKMHAHVVLPVGVVRPIEGRTPSEDLDHSCSRHNLNSRWLNQNHKEQGSNLLWYQLKVRYID